MALLTFPFAPLAAPGVCTKRVVVLVLDEILEQLFRSLVFEPRPPLVKGVVEVVGPVFHPPPVVAAMIDELQFVIGGFLARGVRIYRSELPVVHPQIREEL